MYDAYLGQRALVAGPRPTSARRADREGRQALSWIDNHQPVGLATCEAIFAKCLVRATPIEMEGQALPRTRSVPLCNFTGGPKRWCIPGTSANASSMEIRSTSV